MAQRLATEYVNTCLVLEEAELLQLLQLFQNYHLAFKVKVLDNGDQDVLFENGSGRELILTFERKIGRYVLEGSCRFTDLKLANAMRKAISLYKGNAVVNRIYEFHTVEYVYRSGQVVRITERSRRGERLVYEHKDTAGEMFRTFNNQTVEAQIQVVRVEINELLDLRNVTVDPEQRKQIDEQLKAKAQMLFVLEA